VYYNLTTVSYSIFCLVCLSSTDTSYCSLG
jgi:hypothetical protein